MASNDEVNHRNYWISLDDKQAIWFDSTFHNWKIGDKSDLGSSTAYLLYSTFDTQCPNADGNRWKFWNGENFIEAGDDAQLGSSIGE